MLSFTGPGTGNNSLLSGVIACTTHGSLHLHAFLHGQLDFVACIITRDVPSKRLSVVMNKHTVNFYFDC